jgi:hypothetical protein
MNLYIDLSDKDVKTAGIGVGNLNWKELPVNPLEMKEDKLVILSHGEIDRIKRGYYDYIVSCFNDIIFKDKSVYFIACDAGKVLADSTFKKGAKEVLAYKQKFMFLTDERYSPENDPFLKVCFYPVRKTIETFLKNGVNEAIKTHKLASNEAKSFIDELAKVDESEAMVVDSFIDWNNDNLVGFSKFAVAEIPEIVWAFIIIVPVLLSTFSEMLEKLRGVTK